MLGLRGPLSTALCRAASGPAMSGPMRSVVRPAAMRTIIAPAMPRPSLAPRAGAMFRSASESSGAGAGARPFSSSARSQSRGRGSYGYSYVPRQSSFEAAGGWGKVATNVGLVAGTAVAAHLFFNRAKRQDSFSPFVKDYLSSTFTWLAGGLTLTAAGAVYLNKSGFAFRLMMANPWLVLGGGLVASIGGMIGVQTLPPGSVSKFACWTLFNASQAAVLCPLVFVGPALLARAGLYTLGVFGSLCYVGATAKEQQYLWLGGPLLAGVTVVALSSLAPMILPATFVRTMAVSEMLSLYGGLAVFSAFILYDTQKVIQHANMSQAGFVRADPMRDSIGLELDFINIFIRMVTILMNGQQRRR